MLRSADAPLRGHPVSAAGAQGSRIGRHTDDAHAIRGEGHMAREHWAAGAEHGRSAALSTGMENVTAAPPGIVMQLMRGTAAESTTAMLTHSSTRPPWERASPPSCCPRRPASARGGAALPLLCSARGERLRSRAWCLVRRRTVADESGHDSVFLIRLMGAQLGARSGPEHGGGQRARAGHGERARCSRAPWACVCSPRLP
mmetsp:Transcript_3827/g.11033  ORF Transcript_3827/g.11033 Transcript_3827/m.11033 type:complete len:201 (-) Transcript_3827:296-898(-)